jgi:ubiquinone/menaquinone biosynthesis C-methylase UbiE
VSWLMATVYDRFFDPTEEACLADWRASLLRPLEGAVLEIGAGTGLNLPHYPEGLDRLVLTEPDPHMRSRLERKHGPGAGGRVELLDATVEALPVDDGTFDAVVSTLVLCSVASPAEALGEIRRVLKPGGRYVFLEHVAADPHTHPRRLRWQHRMEPLWKRVAGNCHLTRRTEDVIVETGFQVEWIEREDMRKSLPLVRPTIRGVAVRPQS